MTDAYTRQLEVVLQLNEMAETGKPIIPLDPEGSGGRVAKDPSDLSHAILAEHVKREIEANKRTMELAETNYDERLELERKNAELFSRLRDLQEKDELSKLEASYAYKKKQAEKHGEDTTKITEEYEQKKTLIDVKYNSLRDKDFEQTAKNQIEITKKKTEDEIKLLNKAFDEEVAIQKEIYNRTDENLRDETELNEILEDVEYRRQNAYIDFMIAKLELQREDEKNTKEMIKLIDALIAKYNASRPTKGGAKKNDDGIIDSDFSSIFSDLASQTQAFNNEMNGILDAMLQRKIDRIDAEIEAEERKFDRLLHLAKDDAKEQRVIERDKERALEKLEEKRRKELVKQARLKKSS